MNAQSGKHGCLLIKYTSLLSLVSIKCLILEINKDIPIHSNYKNLGRTSTLALGSRRVAFLIGGGHDGNETIFKHQLACTFCLLNKILDGSTVFFRMNVLEKSS
jgi:hypothetical protein